MRKILLMAAAALLSVAAKAENTAKLYASNVENAEAGKTTTLTINMENNFDVAGFSFQVYLPEGVKIARNSHIQITERDAEEAFQSNIMNTQDGAKQISYVNPDGGALDGNDGAIVDITLTVDASIATGVYDIKIANISFTDKDAVATKQDDFIVKLGVGMGTGINGIGASAQQSNVVYNLAGQRMNKAQKGVNIIGGKKVLK